MFDFDLGEDLEQIVETARTFATEALAPKLRDHEHARTLGPDVVKSYAEMGLAGLELPEALGGAGLGTLARTLVNEELAGGDAGAALALDPLGPALYPLLEVGGEPALRDFALPLLETRGARALLVTTSDAALEVGAHVSGRVPWVPADRIDLLVLLGAEEVIVVREGVVARQLRGAGLRAAGASELQLESAPIAARWSDPAGAARALARARLHVASLLVGVLRQAAEFSMDYARHREAFGKPIAHHQGLAFMITDMRSAVDGARLLLHEAAWRVDQGHPAEAAAAAAFVEAIEVSRLVGPNSVQILGGHGFMQDYPVEKAMRESRMLGLMLGGIDPAREQAGRSLEETDSFVALSWSGAS
jgi:alkylation response protein AidB-like acyl-CoA dehydrogenase